MLLISLLIAALPAQAEAIHRCAGPDGAIRFSDVPCAGRTDVIETTDAAAVRAWLEELRPEAVEAPSRPSPRVLRAMQADAAAGRPAAVRRADETPRRPASYAGRLEPRPGGERALATCSAIFFDCAGDDADGMDACIARAPVCGSRGGNCCEAAFVNRYEALRRAGLNRSSAVREALLGAD